MRLSDPERVTEVSDYLAQGLPLPKDLSDGDPGVIESGLREYADRLAQFYATGFQMRVLHGAPSVSNHELSGRAIDYGTMTMQPGWAPIQVLDGVAPFGHIDGPARSQLAQFVKGVVESVPARLRPNLTAELTQRMIDQYNKMRALGMLELTGVPAELVRTLGEHPGSQALAQDLLQVALHGTGVFNVDHYMPRQVSAYDLRHILQQLAATPSLDAHTLSNAIADSLPDAAMRDALVEHYAAFLRDAVNLAKTKGFTEHSLRTYASEQARNLLRDVPDLERPSMMAMNEQALAHYSETGDPSEIQNTIDRIAEDTARTFKSTSTNRITLREVNDWKRGVQLRYYYDAAADKYRVAVINRAANGQVPFFGENLSRTQWNNARLRFHFADGSTVEPPVQSERGRGILFEADLPSRDATFELSALIPGHPGWQNLGGPQFEAGASPVGCMIHWLNTWEHTVKPGTPASPFQRLPEF